MALQSVLVSLGHGAPSELSVSDLTSRILHPFAKAMGDRLAKIASSGAVIRTEFKRDSTDRVLSEKLRVGP